MVPLTHLETPNSNTGVIFHPLTLDIKSTIGPSHAIDRYFNCM